MGIYDVCASRCFPSKKEGRMMNCFDCGYPMTEVWEEGQTPTYVCDMCGSETIPSKTNDND